MTSNEIVEVEVEWVPVPRGTVVEYHGSLTALHGRYMVVGHEEPYWKDTASHYVDGVAYTLDHENMGNDVGSSGLWNVRRTSFTVVDTGIEE